MMNKNVEKQACPRCGEKFACSKSPRCWCYEFDLPADVLTRIEDIYDGCLCEKCLKTIADDPKEFLS
jgi:hypothetical protein